MPLTLSWSAIAMRLVLTVIAGILIGYNRSESGKAAGMRTTVLVCLAASIAMIQVNVLLPTAGRPSDSFVMNDLMRLPLGILTGVGFIGGGAILRRDDIVVGVTTAATLWLVTVIGLCLGGGQLGLGIAGTLLGLLALWVLKWVENGLRRERRGKLSLELGPGGPSEEELRRRLTEGGLMIDSSAVLVDAPEQHRKFTFEVHHLRRSGETAVPALVNALMREPGITKLQWRDLA